MPGAINCQGIKWKAPELLVSSGVWRYTYTYMVSSIFASHNIEQFDRDRFASVYPASIKGLF